MKNIYLVQNRKIKDFSWEGDGFGDIKPSLLENHMGKVPAAFPSVKFKLVYDKASIHVIFRVREMNLRIEEKSDQGSIWEDSCVEFFFSPFPDISQGYFNIEMNALNSMLFNFQRGRNVDRIEIGKEDLSMIERYSSLPKDFVPVDNEEVTWFAGYSIPLKLIRKYSVDFAEPESGCKWFANFYKCGDKTNEPHWLTWNRVEKEIPDFHRPEDFGILEFL